MNADDAAIKQAVTGGLTVCTLGEQRMTYVSTAEAAVADALKRQRVAIYGRMLLCPEMN